MRFARGDAVFRRQYEPFDAQLLIQKLEAYQRRQEAARTWFEKQQEAFNRDQRASCPHTPRPHGSRPMTKKPKPVDASSPDRDPSPPAAPAPGKKAAGLRPGDAAKRKAGKFFAMVVQPQGKLIAVRHDAQASYQREYDLQFGARAVDPPRADSVVVDDRHHHDDDDDDKDDVDAPTRVQRPAPKPRNRSDWSLPSQTGDDCRSASRSLWRRREPKIAPEPDDPAAARNGLALPPKHEVPAAEPQSLVGDAVEQIRKEKKLKRRQSVAAFFKMF